MKEHILSFLPSHFQTPSLFRIEIAGITYPFSTYHVQRQHSHIYSFEYVVSGSGTLRIDGIEYSVQQGDVFILPKHHDHEYWSNPKKPLHKLWINVSGSLCDHLLQTYHIHNNYVFRNLDVFDCLSEFLVICETYTLTPQQRSQQTSLQFHKLMLLIHDHSIQNDVLHLSEPVYKAKQRFDDSVFTTISISEVAAHVNMSSSQLTRIFKQQLHQTPYNYLLDKKLEMARLLLSESFLTVQQISDRLAFSDPQYFSNIFKRKSGYTPTQWRNTNRRKSD
ncbi:AraC family transcriptional regulator [Erysipelothrix sp. HDW6B]|uniref:helix-turn-helix transcriptional regulator n=1 Tax=Erysipelothrix sp. HDW6B TaxID=2714929 RepID=UPI00140C6D32|nr:AraC family transcriptional regulator [Erysipelothrix sp. HDW6B]QIK86217.1 AraC family transcriptional regulator [Erysipelothrix sp. HDW6B]